ncbi:MAG: hypothetical protein ACRDKV_02855 [Solirubrobacterales bacterium]
MAEPNRKAADKRARASRRKGLRRGSRKDEKPSRSNREAETGGDASSLRESTTLASEEVKQLLEAAGDASKKIREASRANAASGSGGRPVEGTEATALIGKINKEVQEVLESADEAAEKIRAEARAEDRRVVEETRRRAESVTNEQIDRVSQMSEEVLGELTAVQGRMEALRNAFDQSIRSMGAELGVDDPDVWGTRQNGVEEEESAELRQRLGRRASHKSVQEPKGISEGARLLALQQLMAGADAEAIEKRLRQQFGIEDPKPILDWMGVQIEQAEQTEKPKKR